MGWFDWLINQRTFEKTEAPQIRTSKYTSKQAGIEILSILDRFSPGKGRVDFSESRVVTNTNEPGLGNSVEKVELSALKRVCAISTPTGLSLNERVLDQIGVYKKDQEPVWMTLSIFAKKCPQVDRFLSENGVRNPLVTQILCDSDRTIDSILEEAGHKVKRI